jgi:hypothetical protein
MTGHRKELRVLFFAAEISMGLNKIATILETRMRENIFSGYLAEVGFEMFEQIFSSALVIGIFFLGRVEETYILDVP